MFGFLLCALWAYGLAQFKLYHKTMLNLLQSTVRIHNGFQTTDSRNRTRQNLRPRYNK